MSLVLIYVKIDGFLRKVSGATHLARLKDHNTYELLSGIDGKILDPPQQIIVTDSSLVSSRPLISIPYKSFYYFGTLEDTDHSEPKIKATNFVITKNTQDPLTTTSNNDLGSGIYGRYLESDPYTYLRPGEFFKLVTLKNPLELQDQAHGESLTLASFQTNIYLDRVLNTVSFDADLDEALLKVGIRDIIRDNSIEHLILLWNIVLERQKGKKRVDEVFLTNVFVDYLISYLQGNELTDTLYGWGLHELPINWILRKLGYDGLLASDAFNNTWNRGCVSYNYAEAEILEGGDRRY